MLFHRLTALFILPISACVCLATATTDAHATTSRCTIKIGLGTSQRLSAAQFAIDYSQVQGSFAGSGLGTECRSLLAGAMITANDSCDGEYAQCQWGPNRVLHVAILDSGEGFIGPGEIARCTFETAETPAPLDFAITIDQVAPASSSQASEVAVPILDILSVDCSH